MGYPLPLTPGPKALRIDPRGPFLTEFTKNLIKELFLELSTDQQRWVLAMLFLEAEICSSPLPDRNRVKDPAHRARPSGPQAPRGNPSAPHDGAFSTDRLSD